MSSRRAALTRLTWLALALAPGIAAAGGKSTGSGIQDIQRQLRLVYQQKNPCPATGRTTGNCPGWFVGYIVLPKHGGRYDTANMRWMTDDEAVKTGQDMRW
ncbi:MAG TPA: hypothetical protein VFP65_14330 [Anaeromyxobacteraceae bacterium]|nr:hypothetical protein [Anaeromyxobacteraceae bacterium]